MLARSRSRTADPAPNNSIPLTNHVARTSPNPHLRDPSETEPERPAPEPIPEQEDTKMISTITRKEMSTPLEAMASRKSADVVEHEMADFDARSSSLSDLEESTEDRVVDSSTKRPARTNDDEVDSEAETERLEKTPRKANGSQNTNLGSQNGVEKTPSKLAQEVVLDGSDDIAAQDTFATEETLSLHPSPITPVRDGLELNGPAHPDGGSESPSRKRKRSVSATSSLSEADVPLAKRANSSKYSLDGAAAQTEILQELDIGVAEETTILVDEPETNGINNMDDDADVMPVEPLAPTKGKKGKYKGKRKGRKPNSGNDSEAVGETVEPTTEFEAEALEAEVEDEEDSSRDEELARKRSAFDALRKIEQEFVAFREKHINDQLRQVNLELDLLRRPDSTHHEYLAQLKCVDARRDEKIRYEDTKYRYDFETLNIKTVAERTQLHSQYFQEVREIRSRWIEKCYQDLHALQKDRRQWGAHQTNYNYLYNPKRAVQIQQQTAYNLEVSILSGIAKHVGFPAAPDLPGMQRDDIEADFRAMTIPERPPQPQRIHLRDVEGRTAAEKDFFEQNAWANPSVAHAMLANAQSSFATPTSNTAPRIVSNGSAATNTTIDLVMMSTPASAGGHQLEPGSAPPSSARDRTARDSTPSQWTKTIPKFSQPPTRLTDAERIQTSHNGSAANMTSTTAHEMSLPLETSLPNHVFPTISIHGGVERDVFGSSLEQSSSTLTAAVGGGGGGGGTRFPP